ncbi:MAG: alpha/beta fold hydrolase [Solibacillus sp.]
MGQFIEAKDGHLLFTRMLQPEGPSKGHIHLLHGMAEHSGRYVAFAQSLVEDGYCVSMHDHRGHGQTAEKNGAPFGFFAERDGFAQAVEDVETVTRELTNAPFLLFGHSMGSFVARRYAQLYPQRIEKLILCGTGAASPLHVAGQIVARVVAKQGGDKAPSPLLNELTSKSFNRQFAPNRTDFDWLAQNAEAVDAFMADPYCGFVSTARFYADLSDGMLLLSRMEEMRKMPNIPILLISGERDPVGQNGTGVFHVAKQLTKASKDDVQVYLVEQMRHEVLNEKNRAHTIAHIKRWLRK